ncbi:hypothetical protein CgunFtcFv8_027500 [Champsocephalus gunnari]|uniref:Uncharacterized protein n=1 Tax=Champsocephalus gunnari TaxID=52237 RepID=A0AAN8HXE7_CHAGU|nr:hypothetical protein CgunFtcFv8_027500 [Champsocephalus gunnari]
MEEVELDLGKGLESPPTGKVPTTPSSDEEIAVFPVRSPKVRFMSLGVKKPANPLQLLVLTCAAKPPPDEGFCPKAAPQQRDWGWGGSPWEWAGEAENPPHDAAVRLGERRRRRKVRRRLVFLVRLSLHFAERAAPFRRSGEVLGGRRGGGGGFLLDEGAEEAGLSVPCEGAQILSVV